MLGLSSTPAEIELSVPVKLEHPDAQLLGEGEQKIITEASAFIRKGKPGDMDGALFMYLNEAHRHEDQLVAMKSAIQFAHNRMRHQLRKYAATEFVANRKYVDKKDRMPKTDIQMELDNDPKYLDLSIRVRDLEILEEKINSMSWELRSLIRPVEEK